MAGVPILFQAAIVHHKRGYFHHPLPNQNQGGNQVRATITPAMRRLAPSLVFLILILLSEASMGQVEMIEDGMRALEPFIKMHRKVLMEFTNDYDYGRANCKHDPRKEKCGKIA